MKRFALPAGLALVLCLTSGCALSVEADLPDVEITQPDVQVPAVPAEAQLNDTSVAVPFVLSVHDRLRLRRDSYHEVRVREVRLTARTGVTDLSFLRALRITVAGGEPGQTTTAPVEIARYDGNAPASPTLVLPRNPPADVTAPFRADTQLVIIELAGTLPPRAWSADISVRLSATVRPE